ncbi:MAG: AMP-binding protein [Planctomycetia bacterium]|nr:AMP-binding protein [Planctomycetia bacterium]
METLPWSPDHFHPDREYCIPEAFVDQCRGHLFREKVTDSLGMRLTGGTMLLRSLILRRLLNRHALLPREQEPYVGLLIPSSVVGLLANAALMLDRRVYVNLNFTLPNEILNACIRKAGIRHILTSRKVMEKFPNLKPEAELVYMEDLPKHVTTADKLAAAAMTYLAPAALTKKWLHLDAIRPDDLMTIIFTSGSTGDPKGVMLTHRNIGSNVHAFTRFAKFSGQDMALGVLPFFHSFGNALMSALFATPMRAVMHTSPLEYRVVGQLCRKHGVTVVIGTPTFMNTYLRRCEAEDFRTVDLVVLGAEKMPVSLADAFEKKFGVRPIEGYGVTETSPVICGNLPTSRRENWRKDGSVGVLIPEVELRVTHLETGEVIPPGGGSGMIWVRGPCVMKGYLNEPEKTAEVIRDGWYRTNDIGFMDEDGYTTLTGRQSRFSKLGGEMVPHLKVEEAILEAVPEETDTEEPPMVVVTGVPDRRKGERLIVLHTGLRKSAEMICSMMRKAGFPPLWIPSPDSFFQVDSLPILGTGKLDLRALNHLAQTIASKVSPI